MKICPHCKRLYNGVSDYYCLSDNYRLVEYSDEQSKKDHVEQVNQASQNKNIPKCPTCQSTNIKKISTTNRLISVATLGLASSKIGKQFECKNCGYKW